MRSFSVGLTIVSVTILLATAAFAADPQFNLTLKTFDANAALVDLKFPFTALPACIPAPPYCEAIDFRVTVSPCPLDVPCTGDSYEFSVTRTDIDTHLRLAVGTTYHFTGTLQRQWGKTAGSQCNFACFLNTPMQPADFVVPGGDDFSQWDVVRDHESVDTVWVSVQLGPSQYENYNPCSGQYPKHLATMITTPPILGARAFGGWFPITTLNGTSTLLYELSVPVPAFQVALSPNTVYRFDGSRGTQWLDSSFQPECTFNEYLNETVFNTTVLAVQPTTWGRVKALYRSP